jgi:mannose-6-phosphate isomerase-like protein (cupin superfamily)
MSRTGQTLVDVPEATILILADRPELVMTYARLHPEGGPPLHIHRQHADGFVLLDGDLQIYAGVHHGRVGKDMVWVAPPNVPHTYRHESTEEVRFLNIHAPGMGFADYLFGDRQPHEADQFEPPGGDPPGDAIVLRIDDGEMVTDMPQRTIRILADLPELALTWTRYEPGEQGPPPHIHREHVDAFFLLDGELRFQVGPEPIDMTAGPNTFVLVPPYVTHTFHNAGPAEARWINLHAPSTGFAQFLRDPDSPWDSFAPPEDGGRAADEVIVQQVHPA